MTLDQPVPDFTAISTGATAFRLSAQAGRGLVLYFYPKDDTPGCTTETAAFRDHHAAFQTLAWDIVGVSRDSLSSHQRFKAKLELPFELLSDPDETLCELFGVMKLKNMYGKQVRGVERSTFLIDRSSVLRREWRGVKVPGHVEDVLQAVSSLV
jgi:peroxiredoxin Q/BCP